jgi:ribosomal protein S11
MTLIRALKLIKKNRVSKLTFIMKQAKVLVYAKVLKAPFLNQKKIYKDYYYKPDFPKENTLKQNLNNYIIKINATKTNTFLNITDSKGNLKLSFSAGKLGLKKRQKIAQPNALIQLLKKVFLRAKFLENKTIGLQFRSIKPSHELLVLNMLKNIVFITSIRSYNLYPHNGCRPKKLKRFKRRTKRLSL